MFQITEEQMDAITKVVNMVREKLEAIWKTVWKAIKESPILQQAIKLLKYRQRIELRYKPAKYLGRAKLQHEQFRTQVIDRRPARVVARTHC